MDLPERIVVGSDGSTTAARAVEVAATLALATGASLVVTTVWRPAADDRRPPTGGDDAPWEGEETWAEQVTADAVAAASRLGVAGVTRATPAGDPSPAIRELAAQVPGTLVVVGSVGLDSGPERRLGSIPHDLAHRAPGDLLLVRPDTGPAPGWSEVLLTTDGSDTSVHAARTGLALARVLELPPALVSVGRDVTAAGAVLRAVAAGLDDHGPLALEPVEGEDVSHTLIAAARDRGLLVLGNRRMHGLGRLLGSVPDDLVHRLPSDLLLVNTPR